MRTKRTPVARSVSASADNYEGLRSLPAELLKCSAGAMIQRSMSELRHEPRYEGSLIKASGALVTATFQGRVAPFRRDITQWQIGVDFSCYEEPFTVNRSGLIDHTGEFTGAATYDSRNPGERTLSLLGLYHAATLLRGYTQIVTPGVPVAAAQPEAVQPPLPL